MGEIAERILRKIMDYCFPSSVYLPMHYANTRFETEYRVELSAVPCPHLSLDDILGTKIVGYREKINGTLVRRATVYHGENKITCWMGAISCPEYRKDIRSFELRGTEAFSIEPFNVIGDIVFPCGAVTFKSRQVHLAVDPSWEDGAIALVLTPGGIIEKRIKRVITAELLLTGPTVELSGRVYTVRGGAPPPGVYECAWYKGEVCPQKFRPWKQPVTNFFSLMGMPTVHALRPIPERKIVEAPGPLRASRDMIMCPAALEIAPILAACRANVAQAEMFAYPTPAMQGEALQVETYYVGGGQFLLEATDGALRGQRQRETDLRSSFQFQVSDTMVATPSKQVWLRPRCNKGMMLSTGRKHFLKQGIGWVFSHVEGIETKLTKDYSDQAVYDSHRWAFESPGYVDRLYLRKDSSYRAVSMVDPPARAMVASIAQLAEEPPPLPRMSEMNVSSSKTIWELGAGERPDRKSVV